MRLCRMTGLLLAGFLAVGLPACGGGSNAGLAPRSLTAVKRAASGVLYVANQTSNSIAAFALNADDDVAPLRVIVGPHTGLATPTDVAADGDGNVYVVNNGASPFSITVYAAGAAGDARPLRTISGSATLLEFPVYVRVDAAETIYVSNAGRGGPFSSVTEYGSDANGNVPPARVLQFEDPRTGLHCFFPGALAIDAAGNLLVASSPTSSNAEIATYAPGATDCSKPLRVLRGAETRLTSPGGIALNALTGALYVIDSESLPPRLLEFSAQTDSEGEPRVSIAGGSTGMLLPGGVAVDETGSIYVANTGGNSVTVYASSASGDAVPIRAIRGTHTGLQSPRGIAISPR